MHLIPFKGYIFDSTKAIFDQDLYDEMRAHFMSLFEKGIFYPASGIPSYYILEIKNEKRLFTGLVTLTSIQDYISGKIKAHEQTIIKKQVVHKKLLASRKAMIKPAAVVINKNKKLNEILNQVKKSTKPLLSIQFPDASCRHQLWIVNDQKKIEKINIQFKNINKAIIADGHHRFATVAEMNNKKSPAAILTAFFTADQMEVSSFYRIHRPLKRQSSHLILKALQEKAIAWKKIKAIPTDPGDDFYLIHQKNTYVFALKKNKEKLWAHQFHDQITGGIFKIINESRSERIHFEQINTDKNELAILADKYADDFIFKLPLMDTHQILQNKKLLPPKSTQFIPRIINGLVVHLV
jgi:uncharacterized protein (DUF1015 family)